MAAADTFRKYGRGFRRAAGRVLEVAFGTGADDVAAGNHDHSDTGVGRAGLATTYRGGQVTPPLVITGASATGGAGDFLVLFKGAMAQQYTLPNPATAAGRTIVFYDAQYDAGTNNKTIARFGAEKIGNVAADKVINANGGRVTLTSDGTDWLLA